MLNFLNYYKNTFKIILKMSVFVGEHESPKAAIMGAAGMVGASIVTGAKEIGAKVSQVYAGAHHVMHTGIPHGEHMVTIHERNGGTASFMAHGK